MLSIDYSNLANNILENETDYMEGKKLISSFFSHPCDKAVTLEEIKLRLVIIDSMYSTQMNRRLFGIEDLAKQLLVFSEGYDHILSKKAEVFLTDPSSGLKDIFDMKFGIDKKGKENGLAVSLISKYLYFLLEYNFPIYDRLVRIYLPKINERLNILDQEKIPESASGYFSYMTNFNIKSSINDFNKLDNLCWLYGKIYEGSFSLLIEKKKYISLISYSNVDASMKSKDIDLEIASALGKKIPDNIFSNKEIEFIKWVYNTG